MEILINEIQAKSHFIESLKCRIFFSWDIFSFAEKKGLPIDLNALKDPTRSVDEGLKLVYMAALKYSDNFSKLTNKVVEVPNYDEFMAWLSIKQDEATLAMNYCLKQLQEHKKELEQPNAQKKKLSELPKPS